MVKGYYQNLEMVTSEKNFQRSALQNTLESLTNIAKKDRTVQGF